MLNVSPKRVRARRLARRGEDAYIRSTPLVQVYSASILTRKRKLTKIAKKWRPRGDAQPIGPNGATCQDDRTGGLHRRKAVVLVTGAQQGIGRAMALEFAAAGADVASNWLDDDAAAQRVAMRCALADGGRFWSRLTSPRPSKCGRWCQPRKKGSARSTP